MHVIFLCISIGAAVLLTISYSRSEPYDRSILDLITSICAAGAVCFAIHRYPSLLNTTRDRKGEYDTIPLEDYGHASSTRLREPPVLNSNSLNAGRQTILLVSAIIALAIRLELYRRISETAQCSTRTLEALIPLAVAINECRYQKRFQPETDEDIGGSIYDAIAVKFKLYLLQPTWRYVPPAMVLGYGCYSVAALWEAQTSSYICPVVANKIVSVSSMQRLAVTIDCLIAIIAQDLARSSHPSRQRRLSFTASYAIVLLGGVLLWTAYAFVLYSAKQEDMQWFLVNDSPSVYRPIWLMLGQSLIAGGFMLSTLISVTHYGFYQMSMILTATITTFAGVQNLWFARHPFPPNVANVSIWSFLMIYLGVWSSLRIARAVGQSAFALSSSAWQGFWLVVLLILVLPPLWGTDGVHFHPIDALMFEAKSEHENYIAYASKSTDLQSAVNTYRERYQNEPPPGFDKWYEYAKSRSVLIMDDYDQIHRDLLPFRTTSPAELRKQTWEMVSNPWNEISGIAIRNGKAEVQENVLPTHRWMLEGVATLINAFAQHLPDVDLAFNLNDESRVAVPNAAITARRNQAKQMQFGHQSTWSPDRAATWTPVAAEQYSQTVFENLSFQKNFHRFGSIGCPSTSLAATHPHLSSQSHLCLQCLEPHTMGQFVSNWTLAADMCHQPDMSQLHGFYLSPAAFKTSHELMPVFSQSKASGYNDIIYPSSWNYMDKVVYQPSKPTGEIGTETYTPGYPDPPFHEKENILYWRGATSEGVSAGNHVWRGMVRQRLVHLANNATSNSLNDRVTVLLPDQNRKEEYTYHNLPGSALNSLRLREMADIKIVDHIARCGGRDCTAQEQEFKLVTPVDFQEHWRYRYLVDMDGAGFSGRFLPFLQSHSLPFKTALFREWYDSRITAWRHFVPIDMRLHGVWSTLAYFAGVDGIWPDSGGKSYKWEAHTVQGEIIAEEGRKWAAKVLRKEDMEVYFFRLLLEWGRLTDDRRDELGFTTT